MNNKQRKRAVFAASAAATALLLSACASTPEAAAPAGEAAHDAIVETKTATPRVALSYDGGILVLDGNTLELESDIALAGFNRLNPAGDGRHAFVTTSEGFRVLDMGTWTEGTDHHHLTEPALTDLLFEANEAGHVVRHGGTTVLFADGSGDATVFASDALLHSDGALPPTETVASEHPHHGVAIELTDGTLLSTLGTPDARSGIRVLDSSRTEIARNEQCPSVHGEGTAANEVAVFGCADGVLVYDDGVITKITSPDAYGRTGNAYVSESSPIAVGDYNSNPDSEGYLLTQLLLIDTEAKTSKVVALPEGVSYTWRDVARGPNDEILLLSSDGALYTLDELTGEVLSSQAVIAPWQSPAEWQDAHPALIVQGGTAYVTEPATQSIHAVDLSSGSVTSSKKLPAVPNEIAVVTG